MAQREVSSCWAGTQTDQLQKRQRLELLLGVTLPFKRRNASQNLFVLAIDQTRKRWVWFTKSREMNDKAGTELGTLVYLPWEIRQQIFKAVLNGARHDTPRIYYTWGDQWNGGPESEALRYADQALPSTGRAHDIFYLASYVYLRHSLDYIGLAEHQSYGNSKTIPKTIPLRLSSPALGLEFDDFFLSNSIFKFGSPARLQMFLPQLSDFHQTKLRRIIIGIWVPCGCRSRRLLINWRDGWKTVCLLLPASLQRVSFLLDYSRGETHTGSCRRKGDKRLPNEFKAAANLVEVLSKMIVRTAPAAVVEMHESAKQGLLPRHRELFDAAVNDVER